MSGTARKRFMGIPDEFWVGFIIMVAFFLKLVYTIKIGYQSGTIYAGSWLDLTEGSIHGGHVEVIHYYFTFHKLPDFSPVGYPGYALPPLYYIISSLFMELLHRLMHWSAPVSLHVLLSLNVIYVSIGESCGLAILRRFGVRGRNLVTAVFFLFYFPGFYLLSGAMDGSALAFMFSMLALSGVLSWYDSRRQKVLLLSALYDQLHDKRCRTGYYGHPVQRGKGQEEEPGSFSEAVNAVHCHRMCDELHLAGISVGAVSFAAVLCGENRRNDSGRVFFGFLKAGYPRSSAASSSAHARAPDSEKPGL